VTSQSASLCSTTYDAPDSPLTVLDSDEDIPDILSLVSTFQETTPYGSVNTAPSSYEDEHSTFILAPPSKKGLPARSSFPFSIVGYHREGWSSTRTPELLVDAVRNNPDGVFTCLNPSLPEAPDASVDQATEDPNMSPCGEASPRAPMSQSEMLSSLTTVFSRCHVDEPTGSRRRFFFSETTDTDSYVNPPKRRRLCCCPPSVPVDFVCTDDENHRCLGLHTVATSATMLSDLRPIQRNTSQDQPYAPEYAPSMDQSIAQNPDTVVSTSIYNTVEVDGMELSIIDLIGKISDHQKQKIKVSKGDTRKRETYAALVFNPLVFH
jgi:hypothetical protein